MVVKPLQVRLVMSEMFTSFSFAKAFSIDFRFHLPQRPLEVAELGGLPQASS